MQRCGGNLWNLSFDKQQSHLLKIVFEVLREREREREGMKRYCGTVRRVNVLGK